MVIQGRCGTRHGVRDGKDDGGGKKFTASGKSVSVDNVVFVFVFFPSEKISQVTKHEVVDMKFKNFTLDQFIPK